MSNKILCAQWGTPAYGNPWTVALFQTGFDRFTVTYGKQERASLDYGEAAEEFGACVMHAAACDGNLDNRSRAEAAADGDSSPIATSL